MTVHLHFLFEPNTRESDNPEVVLGGKDHTASPRAVRVVPPGAGTVDFIPSAATRASQRNRLSLSLKGLLPAKKRLFVGVEMAHNHLRLFKLRKLKSGIPGSWEVLDYLETVLESGPKDPTGAAAHRRLREKLNLFCGNDRRVSIWCLLEPSSCDIRRLQVPRLARRRLTQAVYWGLRKTAGFDDHETLFDYEILGQTGEGGIQRTEVLAYSLPRSEVNRLKTLFLQAGFPLAGLTLPPFALQNMIQTMPADGAGGLLGLLHVGETGSCISIFSNQRLVFTRSVRTGMESLFEALMANGLHEGADSPHLSLQRDNDGLRLEEEALKFGETHGRQMLSLLTSSPYPYESGRPEARLDANDILRLVIPPIERLVRQAELSFTHFAQSAGTERVAQVYLVGEITLYPPLLSYIQEHLGIPVQPIDTARLQSVLAWRTPPPEDPGAFGRLSSALAVAMPTRKTQNLFETHLNREKTARITFLNRGIFVVFIAAVAVGLALLFWQGRGIEQRRSDIARLEAELNGRNPRVNRALLLDLAGRVQTARRKLLDFSERYALLAILHELTEKTPSHVRLVRFGYADAGPSEEAKPPTSKQTVSPAPSAPVKIATVEGIISGEERSLDIRLSAYLAALETSPLLGSPVVERQNRRFLDSGAELNHFVLRMNLHGPENL